MQSENINTENVVPNQVSVGVPNKTPLKPVADKLYLTPGKKVITPAKAQTVVKSKLQTPKESFSSTLTSNFTTSTIATSVTRPKTCSKLPSGKSLISKGELFTNSMMSPSCDMSVISSSTTDTMDAREAARIAKIQSTQRTLLKVNLLKEKWAKEKQQKLAQHQERRQQEMKKLHEDNANHAELRRKQIEKQREIDESKKEKEKMDIFVRHESNIQMKKDVEQEKQARRRISIFLNTQIRKKQQQVEKDLQDKKKQEEIEDLTLKRLDALTVREKKTVEQMKRRESLHNRLEKDKIAKEKEKEVFHNLYYKRDQDILEIRYDNWKDEKVNKELQQLQEKEDMRKQYEIFVQQKQQEKKQLTMKELEKVNLLKTRELNYKDEQIYKQSLQEQEHNEVLWKLNHWKLTKQYEEELNKQKSLQEQISKELELKAYQDMKDYQTKLKEQRRQSLSYRLQKARKDKDYELGQKSLQQMVQEEEKRIQELDRSDVKNYQQHLQDLRRQSLEYRSQLYYQERMRQQGEEQAQKQEEHNDYELRYQAWKDVQDHIQLERQKKRESVAWRIADAHRQHELELTKHQEKLRALHLDIQCRREDWLALQEHKADEAEKRRKSIQFRLQSWKKQKMFEEQQKLRELMMEEENAILKEMDREELLAAKLTNDMMERHNLLSSSNMQV